MRAALSRAAKKENHRRGAAPQTSAHASRSDALDWRTCTPRPPRLRAERRARRTRLGAATRVEQACHYGYDAHGNVTFLTDATGAVTDSYDYDAWGNIVAGTGSTPNSRLYTGEEFDPDLGLINLRARQYWPGSGRFLTIDPGMGNRRQPVSLNRYLYANGDPTNARDPLGKDALYWLAIAILADVVPYNAYIGTNGRLTHVKTSVLVGLGMQIACVFWRVADALAMDLRERLGRDSTIPPPPWPWGNCTASP